MDKSMREAMFCTGLEDGKIRCDLCPRHCSIPLQGTGFCRSRKNLDGTLFAVNYAQAIGGSFDSIEKKPLYHYRPGSVIYSLGPNSCNLSCSFCQNYQVSQQTCPVFEISPHDLAENLKKLGAGQVAFTYTEPFTWYEYIHDFALLAPDVSIVLVTNGYIDQEPLRDILPHISAMNIDLKAIDPDFYRDHCNGDLKAVLDTIEHVYSAGVHLELTNLIIPGLNSSDEEISKLVSRVGEISTEIPLHFSAYHPAYHMTIPPTPASLIASACEYAKKSLRFVYAGNISYGDHTDTVCPACGQRMISRSGRNIVSRVKPEGSCPDCGTKIYGVFR